MPQVKRRYYALVFVLLLALTGLFMPQLSTLDWQLFDKLASAQRAWPDDFEVVDIEWDNNPKTTEAFRLELASVLQTLAQQDPPVRTVVIDVSISSLPLGLPQIAAAMDQLVKRRTDVFAAINVRNGVTNGVNAQYQAFSASDEFYSKVKRFGHTEFNVNGDSVWYEPCLLIKAPDKTSDDMQDDRRCVPALVEAVASKGEKLDWDADALPVLVRPGADNGMQEHVWQLRNGRFQRASGVAAVPDWGQKTVFVGNLKYDRISFSKGSERAGVEVLARVIADQAAPANQAPRTMLLVGQAWLPAFTAGFAGLSLLCFSGVRRRWRWLSLNLLAAGALSLGITLLALMAVVLTLRAAGAVYPQVTFVVLAVLYAVSLAVHYARARLRIRAIYEDVSHNAVSGSEPLYDVFISYSRTPRENAAWVKDELYQRLLQQRLDGQPLRIFFDETSIRVGSWWYFKLAESIQRSHCFVAIASEEYFNKGFCSFEMAKAAVRNIQDRQHFAIVPVARGATQVPAVFDHIQFRPCESVDALVDQIMSAVRAARAGRMGADEGVAGLTASGQPTRLGAA